VISPLANSIKVFFENKEIKSDKLGNGWAYDPVNNEVVLGHNLKFPGISEQNPVVIEFTPKSAQGVVQ